MAKKNVAKSAEMTSAKTLDKTKSLDSPPLSLDVIGNPLWSLEGKTIPKLGSLKQGKIRHGFMEETNLGAVLENIPGLDRARVLSSPFGYTRQSSTGLPIPNARGNSPRLELRFNEGAAWTQIPDATELPWRCICHLDLRFQYGRSGHGTGWLVDGKTIITAGHNLLHPKLGWATGIAVRPGYNQGGTGYGQDFPAIMRDVHSNWRAGVEQGDLSYQHDIGYIRIKDVGLGDYLGYFGIRILTDDELRYGNLIVHSAGYPSAEWPGSMWADASRIRDFDEHYLYYRLDTEEGNSGAPIFATFPDGRRYVVAGHVHGTEDQTSNAGLRITDEIFDAIADWIG